VLNSDKAHVVEPALIADIKELVVKIHGPDAVKPDIDIICCTLAVLGRSSKFNDCHLCLVDCRYAISILYRHPLMRPSEVDM